MGQVKAPEKIYIHPDIGGGEFIRLWLRRAASNESVEYTRTDAFIEKVESFLNKKDDRDSYTIGYIKRHLKEIIKEIGL